MFFDNSTNTRWIFTFNRDYILLNHDSLNRVSVKINQTKKQNLNEEFLFLMDKTDDFDVFISNRVIVIECFHNEF